MHFLDWPPSTSHHTTNHDNNRLFSILTPPIIMRDPQNDCLHVFGGRTLLWTQRTLPNRPRQSSIPLISSAQLTQLMSTLQCLWEMSSMSMDCYYNQDQISDWIDRHSEICLILSRVMKNAQDKVHSFHLSQHTTRDVGNSLLTKGWGVIGLS